MDCGHGWRNDNDCDICRPPAVVVAGLRGRVRELEAALKSLVADVDDYERVNNLAPSPGRLHCWQSMQNAKELLEIET